MEVIFETRLNHVKKENTMNNEIKQHKLPESGLLRLWQILGDRKRGVPPIIPVSKSHWWFGVKVGKYPKPIKLSARCTCWRVEDIRAMIDRCNAKNDR